MLTTLVSTKTKKILKTTKQQKKPLKELKRRMICSINKKQKTKNKNKNKIKQQTTVKKQSCTDTNANKVILYNSFCDNVEQ